MIQTIYTANIKMLNIFTNKLFLLFFLGVASVVFLLIIGLGNTASVLEMPNNEFYQETKSVSFEGGVVDAEAPRFGRTSSDSTVVEDGLTGKICGVNNGELVLTSNLDYQQSGFIASGKLASTDNNANCYDYVTQSGKIEFNQAGKLTATCTVKVSSSESITSAICKIAGNTLKITGPSSNTKQNLENTKTYTIDVSAGEVINYEFINTVKSSDNSKKSESILDLTFSPDYTEEVSNNEVIPEENEGQTENSETKLNFIQRFNQNFQKFINWLRGGFK